MRINQHELAVKVSLIEGQKISISIAQIKEVLKIVFIELSLMDEATVLETLRYHKQKLLELED